MPTAKVNSLQKILGRDSDDDSMSDDDSITVSISNPNITTQQEYQSRKNDDKFITVPIRSNSPSAQVALSAAVKPSIAGATEIRGGDLISTATQRSIDMTQSKAR